MVGPTTGSKLADCLSAASVRLRSLRWPHTIALHHDIDRRLEVGQEVGESRQFAEFQQLLGALVRGHCAGEIRLPLVDHGVGRALPELPPNLEHA